MTEALKAATTVEVDIYGATYHVRGENDPEHLRRLAGLVDDKMREVATHVATVDTAKIAILAALNIAEDLVRSRKGRDGEREEISVITDKVEMLTGRLQEVLDA